MEAASVDPDVDEREAAERYDSEPVGGITSHGGGDSNADEGVEHHERTRTADEEQERHFKRDDRRRRTRRGVPPPARVTMRNEGPPTWRTPIRDG